MATSAVSNEQLREIRDRLKEELGGMTPQAWRIADEIKSVFGVTIHDSTIRGRFIEMGELLLGGGVGPKPATNTETAVNTVRAHINESADINTEHEVSDELKEFMHKDEEFDNYVIRDVDKRLAVHYNLGLYPITQGPQGTGKTMSHSYCAYAHKLPHLIISCFEDMTLAKFFGNSTIKNGSIEYKEGIFVRLTQAPSFLTFDEINAVGNAKTFDFHALLENRQLFIKDANNGDGKMFKLHPHCKIGFAQNPKSAKYSGGNIKGSAFLGRCSFIDYPQFTEKEIIKAIGLKFPQMIEEDRTKFAKFFFVILKAIEDAALPLDISIRQLNTVIKLWLAGIPIQQAIEDGMASMVVAVSQPKAKESFMRLAGGIWTEVMG